MDIIDKSLEIALKAHAGQKDKAGKTYILHPLRLMAKMNSDEERSVALLHDVIKDLGYTATDLLALGIPANVVAAITLLSKRDGEDYQQFISRITAFFYICNLNYS